MTQRIQIKMSNGDVFEIHPDNVINHYNLFHDTPREIKTNSYEALEIYKMFSYLGGLSWDEIKPFAVLIESVEPDYEELFKNAEIAWKEWE